MFFYKMFSADTEHIYVPGPAENIVWQLLCYDKFWRIICSPIPNVLHNSGEHMTCSNLTYILPNSGEHMTNFDPPYVLHHKIFSQQWRTWDMTDLNPSYILPNSGEHKACFKLLYVLQCNGHRIYMTGSNSSYISSNRAEAVKCTLPKIISFAN